MLSRLSRAKIPAISLECAGRVHKMNNWSRKYKNFQIYLVAYTQMAPIYTVTLLLICYNVLSTMVNNQVHPL